MGTQLSQKITNIIIQNNFNKVYSKDDCISLGVSQSCYRNILQKNGLKWNKKIYRKYQLNHDYFSIIDSPEKAYWLGFLFADGHISKENSLCIQLQSRDIKNLEMLKNDLSYSGPIKERTINNKKYFGLVIYSVKICQDLKLLGFSHNKTLNPSILKIHENNYKVFIRGLIDGDGTIWVSKNASKFKSVVNILLHEKIINSIELMINNFNIPISFSKTNHHRTSYLKILSFNGNRNTYELLKFLYEDQKRCLERKFDQYNKIKNYYINNPTLLQRSRRSQYQPFHYQAPHFPEPKMT